MTLISRSQLAPSEAHAPIQHATTTIRCQFHIHLHGCLHLFIKNSLYKLLHICWYNNQEYRSFKAITVDLRTSSQPADLNYGTIFTEP